MNIAVVTDSTAFLKEEYKNHKDLYVLPVPLIIDDVVYQEGVDIHTDGFYDKLNKTKEFPKTSQPALGEVYELYEELSKKGYDAVISIHLSSGISGFITTLNSVAKEVDNISVYPFDSLITSGPMGKMVEVALDMRDQPETMPSDIISSLENIRNHAEGLIVVDDLNHLVRGGRLKNGAAIIGTLLKIKPILKFDNGEIVLRENIRSQKKAIVKLETIVLNEISTSPKEATFYIIHCNNLDLAISVKDDLLNVDPSLEVILCEFGPVIGTHLGEKSIAIGVVPKK